MLQGAVKQKKNEDEERERETNGYAGGHLKNERKKVTGFLFRRKESMLSRFSCA